MTTTTTNATDTCRHCGWIIAPEGVHLPEADVRPEGAKEHRCDDAACVVALAAPVIPPLPEGDSYVGTCPVCLNVQKLESMPSTARPPAGLRMVLHGYQRPGDGQIAGRCWGVADPPWEVSPIGAIDHEKRVATWLFAAREQLTIATDHGHDEYTREESDMDAPRDRPGRLRPTKTVRYPREADPHSTYARLREAFIREYAMRVRHLEGDLERLRARIAAWTPGELTTAAKAEREAAELAATKRAERKAAADAKRAVAATKRRITDLRWAVDSACASIVTWTTWRKDSEGAANKVAEHQAKRDMAAKELAPLVGKTEAELIKFYTKKHTR